MGKGGSGALLGYIKFVEKSVGGLAIEYWNGRELVVEPGVVGYDECRVSRLVRLLTIGWNVWDSANISNLS